MSSDAERPKCMHCSNPAELVCKNCGESAICDNENDEYCPKCGEETGKWVEWKPGKKAGAKKAPAKKAAAKKG